MTVIMHQQGQRHDGRSLVQREAGSAVQERVMPRGEWDRKTTVTAEFVRLPLRHIQSQIFTISASIFSPMVRRP